MTGAEHIKAITSLVAARESHIATLHRKISKLTAQRDEARGRAAEYKAYALKYQRELAELRNQLKQRSNP
jgi:peptidoglycan hydrolase CwlO-like protein